MNNLENKITEYGFLAELAYKDFTNQVGKVVNDKYKIIDISKNSLTGFYAVLFQNTQTDEFTISFRGTNDLFDISSWYGEKTPQYYDAVKFVADTLERNNINKSNLTFTGHSLGGILTAQLSVEFSVKGYAYNPFGANLLGYDDYKKYADIIKKWSDNNIYTISYQDEGILNGDILSNLLTNLAGSHIGNFIPILGKDKGFNAIGGHSITTLNDAIKEYNEIVKKFDNSCRYEDITNMYLSTAIIHGNGYEKVKEEFTKLGVYGANDNSLHLNVITPTSSVTSIFSGSNLSTPALYALVNLNPFIVSGVNSNAYAELEKYKAEYSENYVSDKAKMFKALMDTPKVGSYYDDYETGKKISYYTSVTDPDSTDEYNLTDTAYTFGTNKNDIVTASVGKANRIYTLAGDDTIALTSGSNYIEAGSGNDTIDLSGITDKNSTNIIYADLKDSDDKDSGNDIIIGSAGKDTMYGGSGFDSYYAGNGDIIEDDDKGQGFVYFNSNSPLTGGTYDKDKGCYVGGIYEYHLNGKTLIVKDTTKDESITINNYHKDKKSLGIDLIKADEIDIIISNATVTKGDESEPNKDGKAPYNTTLDIKLNRKLKEDEFIIIQKYNYKKQATELVLFGTLPKDYDTTLFKNLLSNNKTLDFSWYGNKTKEEDKKYCVGGVNIFAKSDNLTIRDIKPGYVTIKDDDKDPNDDKPETYDPLVIDLNNDGIKGTNLDYKINFDLDNNGFKEATSWIDNNDAFIAIDKNNNGAIDNGSELFGNKSISNNAYAYTNPNAKNGFESLKELDSNNDGIIDEKDKEFTNLLLWQDKNSNGISETDELIKLSDKAEFTNLNLLIAWIFEFAKVSLNLWIWNKEFSIKQCWVSLNLLKLLIYIELEIINI